MMWKTKILTAAVVLGLSYSFGSALAMTHPVTIEDQGSFMAGGVKITAPGVYNQRTLTVRPCTAMLPIFSGKNLCTRKRTP